MGQHGKGCGRDAEVPAAEYDCNAAFANWVKGWSEGKKQWCCKYGYKSCPNDAAAAGAGYGAGTAHGANFNGAPVAAILDIPFAQRGDVSGAWPVSKLLQRAIVFSAY